jgi:hypothetical protein
MSRVNDSMDSSSERGPLASKKQSRSDGEGQACATNKPGMMCFNPKVVVGLVVVALGTWAVAPGLAAAALPILILAACPLSMLLMMRGMSQAERHANGSRDGIEPTASSNTEGESNLANLKGRLANLAPSKTDWSLKSAKRKLRRRLVASPSLNCGSMGRDDLQGRER